MPPFPYPRLRSIIVPLGIIAAALLPNTLLPQQGTEPPPMTAPAPPMPDATKSAGQEQVPAQQLPHVIPDTPLPHPDKTSIDLRSLTPMAIQPAVPTIAATSIEDSVSSASRPKSSTPDYDRGRLFNLIGQYQPPTLPQLQIGSSQRIASMARDGKLYISLRDAIALAVENNLDVEVTRYNLSAADTDLKRARGGGNLRGIDYAIQLAPQGVGSLTSPLLVTSTTGTASTTNVNVTDLSQVSQSGEGLQQSLSENGTSTYSAGPPVPLYDPTISAQAGYLRRSDTQSLTELSGATTTGTSSSGSASTAASDYVNTGVDYQQGFSPGTQIDAYFDNSSQVLYAANSQLDPFHAPSASITITQPLLRGFGPNVNLRFIRIARLNQKSLSCSSNNNCSKPYTACLDSTSISFHSAKTLASKSKGWPPPKSSTTMTATRSSKALWLPLSSPGQKPFSHPAALI